MSFFGYSLRGFSFDDMSETHDTSVVLWGKPPGCAF